MIIARGLTYMLSAHRGTHIDVGEVLRRPCVLPIGARLETRPLLNISNIVPVVWHSFGSVFVSCDKLVVAMSVLKKKASIARAARLLALLTSFPLPVAYLVYKWSAQSTDINVEETPIQTTKTFTYDQNSTILDILQNDDRVSRFAEVVGQLPDIARGLAAPQAKFTLYVPVNEAFDDFFFPPDPPPFYNLFLAGYHMGPGPVQSLSSRSTVTSFVNGDIFFDYKQRISIQHYGDKTTLNHEAKLLSPPDAPIAAVNGFIHHIDTILVLPNSTAHAIRTRPMLSKFRNGLASTGLGRRIYNTNAHISQTVFAPTNAAFDNIGRSASKFLLSRAGQPYLDALLRMHIVANQTLFSDMFWPHGGAQLIDMHMIQENIRKVCGAKLEREA